jgi:acyl carrier protein
MTAAEIRNAIVDALAAIAPEVNLAAIEPGASLRDQVDLDSMDFLRFVLALHERLGVDIPETDYPHFDTLDRAEAYLAARTKAGPNTSARG